MADQEMSASAKKNEDWMNSKWRPAMGWLYMLVCFCDFVVFPVLWSVLHAVLHSTNMTQWNPLTLQGAGLFHLAMGAILGIAAYGRTQEKVAGANNGGLQTPSFSPAPVASSSFTPAPAPSFTPAPAPAAPSSFGGGFNSPAATPAPSVSKFGKVVPTQEDPPL